MPKAKKEQEISVLSIPIWLKITSGGILTKEQAVHLYIIHIEFINAESLTTAAMPSLLRLRWRVSVIGSIRL